MVRTTAGACAVAAALIAFACAKSTTGPGPGPGEVVGVVWRLDALQRPDGSVINPPAGTFTLRFAEDGRLEVRADCNGCGGGYQLSGGAVTVGILACTRAFCPASAPFDAEYVRIVESATTVARGGDTLTLRSAAGALRFVR
jgi:heat shock protein HslJ